MTTVVQHFGLPHHPAIPVGSTAFYCGVEYEIESIKHISDQVKANYHPEVDNSLRNHGMEFKTMPTTFGGAIIAFEEVHAGIKLGADPYTDRTSIHVHVNVQNMELNQLRQLILLYALLEPLYMDFVGEVRKNSIFCVPLNYTYIPSIYKADVPKMEEKWHKYTAFNIKPIKQFGTVEFRHLYGTGDITIFTNWLTAIKELYEFIVKNPTFDIIKLIEEGATAGAFARLTVPSLAHIYSEAALNDKCADTLLDVKLSVGGLGKA